MPNDLFFIVLAIICRFSHVLFLRPRRRRRQYRTNKVVTVATTCAGSFLPQDNYKTRLKHGFNIDGPKRRGTAIKHDPHLHPDIHGLHMFRDKARIVRLVRLDVALIGSEMGNRRQSLTFDPVVKVRIIPHRHDEINGDAFLRDWVRMSERNLAEEQWSEAKRNAQKTKFSSIVLPGIAWAARAITGRYRLHLFKSSYQRRIECYFKKFVLSAVISGRNRLRPLSKFHDTLAEIQGSSPILRLRPLSIRTNFSIVEQQISSGDVPVLGARRKFVAVLRELLARGVPTLRPIYANKRTILGIQKAECSTAFHVVMVELKLGLPILRPIPPPNSVVNEEHEINVDFFGNADVDDAEGIAGVDDICTNGLSEINIIETTSFVTTSKSGRRRRSRGQRSSTTSSVSENCGSLWIDGRRRSARVFRSRTTEHRLQLGTVMVDGIRRSARLFDSA